MAVVTATHDAIHLGSACVTLQAATVLAITASMSPNSWTPRIEVRMTPPFGAITRPEYSQTYFAAYKENIKWRSQTLFAMAKKNRKRF